ncbi:MAG TPA: dihydroorotate dehydrogenase [Candidatus Lokiarchaeia archaeon]|nr:dihydroorotate dehydrogenase [Candidatus Lokiarchaeia archaeon]
MLESALESQFCGITFSSPIILASGILGVSGAILSRLASEGIGGLTSKSIGPEPRLGYTNPSVIEIGDGTVLNAVGLANPGIDEFIEEIPEIRHDGVPLIISIFGETDDEYAMMARKITDAGVDAVELNISCPHAKVSSIGADAYLTASVVSKVKEATSLPVFVKLNPNVTSIVDIALAAENAGADAVVAINTMRGMAIDVETMKPILANKSGGVSGKALKPMAIKAVYDLYESLSIPIIGCGGVFSGLDIIEFLLAGARLVQIGTAFLNGLGIIKTMKNELLDYMERHSVNSVMDLVGKGH